MLAIPCSGPSHSLFESFKAEEGTYPDNHLGEGCEQVASSGSVAQHANANAERVEDGII